ncbi:hypothetical protein Q7689_00625 [Nocardiopsis tropica]|uniref:hypothetical protein n=1 Tax=Nocardiopsis tropica TaxID=109330 RepID=UPI002E8813CC|nr:hypothetical protein [Nocardiopsis tropica]
MSVCEGPCNRVWRQGRETFVAALTAWEETTPDERGDRPIPPDVIPTPGEPVWCRGCAGSIRRALADLDNLAPLVAATSDGYRTRADDSDRVRTSQTAPSPSPAADVLDELYGYLSRIEAQWREARGYGARPERSRGAPALTIVVSWLGAHLDNILADPGSVGFGQSVLRWQRHLQTLAKARPEGRRKPVPCPRCDRRTLVHEIDRDLVRCEAADCGRVMSTDEYDAIVADRTQRAAS